MHTSLDVHAWYCTCYNPIPETKPRGRTMTMRYHNLDPVLKALDKASITLYKDVVDVSKMLFCNEPMGKYS